MKLRDKVNYYFERQCIKHVKRFVKMQNSNRTVETPKWYHKLWFKICSKLEFFFRKKR